MRKKLPIAISSCLLGNQVRYDGRSKTHTYIQKELSVHFSFLVICPEVDMGLTVPRPPMKLTRVDGEIQALDIEQPAIQYTERLKQHAWMLIPLLSEINAYIFKARSPSCGVGTTPLNLEKNQETVNGIFAHEILKAYPDLPIIDESVLETARGRLNFLNDVFDYSNKPKLEKK